MTGISVLIWDTDKSYGNALSEYLADRLSGSISKAVITNIGGKEELYKQKGSFDFAVVNIQCIGYFEGENLGFKIKNKIVLTEEREAAAEGGFYKYQSMKPLLEKISQELRVDFSLDSGKETEMYGIYAPMGMPLSLPIALCFTKFIGIKSDTVFLDLSEVSLLRDLVNFEITKDLIDVLYMLENNEIDSLTKYIVEEEGIYIMPPCLTPSQLSEISGEQWKSLLESIKGCGYKNIVILFGSLVQGFTDMAVNMKKIFVVGDAGEYTALGIRSFMGLMDRLLIRDRCRELTVKSGAGLSKKIGLSWDSILRGELMEYMRINLGGDLGARTYNQSNQGKRTG